MTDTLEGRKDPGTDFPITVSSPSVNVRLEDIVLRGW